MTNSCVWQFNRSVEPIRQPESGHVRHERKRTAATSSSGSNAKNRRSVAGDDRVDRGKASDDWDRADCGAESVLIRLARRVEKKLGRYQTRAERRRRRQQEKEKAAWAPHGNRPSVGSVVEGLADEVEFEKPNRPRRR